MTSKQVKLILTLTLTAVVLSTGCVPGGPPKPLDHDSVGSAIFDPPWRGGDWPLVAEIRPACEVTGRRSNCVFQARGPPLV